MLNFLRRKKTTDVPALNSETNPVKGVLKDDLLGIEDWRRSKIGFLTGFTAATKVVRSVGHAAAEATSRLGFLWHTLTYTPTISAPELDDPSRFNDASERFRAAAALLRVNETKLRVIMNNTFRSFYLYMLVLIAYISMVVFSLIYWPPVYNIEYISRLGAIPIVLALLIKSAYTNWVVRTQSADNMFAFVRSADWLPSKR